ncbi:MAG: hypothetical protein ACRENO_09845 [Thermodesulfobacteriota bacterium]
MKIFSYKYLFILSLLLFISCFNPDKKDINNLLDKRQKSFELKDENLYSDLIFENYNSLEDDKTVNKSNVIEQFKLNVSPFDSISFIKSKRDIYLENGSAKVLIEASIDLKIENEKSTYKTKELLNLIKINNKEWRISKESKLDLFRGFVFGDK